MPIQLNEENGGRVLTIHVSGKLEKSDYEHFSDVERLAMVGKKTWQHGMAMFSKPFMKATIRYFDHADAAEARKWLDEA